MSVVRNAHFFRKLPAELSEASAVGGAISIVAIVSMLALLVSNTHAYLSSTTTQTRLELDVDTSESLLITFNITMQRLPCRFASLDIVDVMGTHLQNVSANILKMRVNAAGTIVGQAEHERGHLTSM